MLNRTKKDWEFNFSVQLQDGSRQILSLNKQNATMLMMQLLMKLEQEEKEKTNLLPSGLQPLQQKQEEKKFKSFDEFMGDVNETIQMATKDIKKKQNND
jgi:hypothetical protein